MKLISGFGWLRSVAPGREVDKRVSDPGDMGTAFGLDASLAGDTDIGAETQNGRSDPETPATAADRLNRRSAR